MYRIVSYRIVADWQSVE